jgi:Glycosyl transferases group 1
MLSLFVFNDLDMYSDPVGGVQLCSQEFLEIIQTASKSIEYFEVSVCRQLLWRIRRKLHLGSYLLYNPKESKDKLLQVIQKNRPSHVFINKSELIRFTPILRELLPEAQIILMSHGNQSGDDLYELAGIEGNTSKGLSRFGAIWQIGQDLATESWYRHRYVDCVCVMSAEEEILERWLGAKNTIVLPRTIKLDELLWNPISGRVGFVGTLNHTPNRIALEQICEEISKNHPTNIELRLVGQPVYYGQSLASKFDFVSYLGALNDDALKSEVSTWNLFLNPIFWLSRGASMKLGKAISWGIPFVTTFSGKRGYQLNDVNFLTTPDNVQEFVARLLELMSDDQKIIRAREAVKSIQSNSPSIHRLADIISTFLCV